MSALLERLFGRALVRAHRMVVVSPYWKRHFSRLVPAMPIDIIYNGFDVDAYAVTPEVRAAFRARWGFDERPLIYLGNCQRAKGVVEAYEALRHLPYHFATSGRRDVELPCPHLDLDREGYRHLLAASDVVLAVSRFLEGWNRTAHEALLAGTPVVGLPVGGLGDLLEGAGQLAVTDIGELEGAVARALATTENLAVEGRAFARRFTLDRFADSWRRLVREEAAQAAR
jgi:glycosyltransferase involved in cell wall biosynthesis